MNSWRYQDSINDLLLPQPHKPKKRKKKALPTKKRIKSFAHLSHLLCVILLSLSYRGLYPPRKSISSNLFLFDAFQSSVYKNTAQPTHCTSCEIIQKFVLCRLKQVIFDSIAKNKAKSGNVFCMFCPQCAVGWIHFSSC